MRSIFVKVSTLRVAKEGSNKPVVDKSQGIKRVTTVYSEVHRAKSIRLFKNGARKMDISRQLCVPESTLRGWLKDCKVLKTQLKPKKRTRKDSGDSGVEVKTCQLKTRKRPRKESEDSGVEVNSCQLKPRKRARKDSEDSGVEVNPCYDKDNETVEQKRRIEFAKNLGLIWKDDLPKPSSTSVRKLRSTTARFRKTMKP